MKFGSVIGRWHLKVTRKSPSQQLQILICQEAALRMFRWGLLVQRWLITLLSHHGLVNRCRSMNNQSLIPHTVTAEKSDFE